jgi:hypothetical protein
MGKNDTKDAIAEAAGFSMPVAKDTSLRLCPLIAFDRNHRVGSHRRTS